MTTKTAAPRHIVHLKRPHPAQLRFLRSTAKRRVVRGGRRGGKTTGLGILAVEQFLAGHRVLYAAPTSEQLGRFWTEVCLALRAPIDAGVYKRNQTEHFIELPYTEQRLKAKTAWNADTLRGDYADILILDEFQLMAEDTWGVVGAPMLLDNDGDAIFIYTPPSLHSAGVTKARDPRHAAKLYKQAQTDTTGRWAAFHFTSRENPHISAKALAEITQDMTALAIRQEIEAEDIDDAPGALWNRALLDKTRVYKHPQLTRIVVGIDPAAGLVTETGIVAVGLGIDGHGYVLEDVSIAGSPDTWGTESVLLYNKLKADRICGEANNGGEMVGYTLQTVSKALGIPIAYKKLTASRGKIARAEPVAALYEQGRMHQVGSFPKLEDELCQYEGHTGQESPNRYDATVWACTELMLGPGAPPLIAPITVGRRN